MTFCDTTAGVVVGHGTGRMYGRTDMNVEIVVYINYVLSFKLHSKFKVMN